MESRALPRSLRVIVTAYLLAAGLCGQQSEAEALPPAPTDLRAYLESVNDRTEALKAVSYRLRIWDRQPDVGYLPIVAEVISEKVPGRLPRLKVDAHAADDAGRWHNMVVHDGETFDQLDWNTRRVVRTPTEFLSRRLQRIRPQLWLAEFTLEDPFDDEVQAASLRHEGRQEVAGVPCEVVLVEYRQRERARWWFGVRDGLPRRVERLRRSSVRVYEISDLRPMVVIPPGTFEYTLPPGFDVRDVRRPDAPAHKRIPAMLEVGREAPRFELTASNGQTVSRRDLRGSVVVLHFWNAWSPPASAEVPKFRTLQQRWGAEGVAFYGVSCYEDPGKDAGAAFQRLQPGYPLLLAGDDLAGRCRVPGVPAWLVIDPAGRVEDCGIGPADEARIERAIRAGLAER